MSLIKRVQFHVWFSNQNDRKMNNNKRRCDTVMR